ncbi:MAG: N-acetyl-gamma-glutamyl-phosphate reductase [Chlamydiota bacterium]|nr:N-acetyl-gamma-glutamyl-phosphate reductase [Chlamydiota bacterium]
MIKIGICGATGYSGRELIEILLRHPEAEISWITSKQYVGKDIADVFAQFRNRFSMICRDLNAEELSKDVDLIFLSLPHTISMSVANVFLSKGIRVIDLSGDYRLKSTALYKKWYGKDHQDEKNLDHAVYGLCELFEQSICTSRFISNPGCFPTGAILAIAPALINGLIEKEGIIIDAKSGVSGAGRGLSLKTHFVEVHENMNAYKVCQHQHMPEIEMVFSGLVKDELHVDFVPHLIPVSRGILTTAYARLSKNKTFDEVQASYVSMYQDKPFMRMLPGGECPRTADVSGSNYCNVALAYNERTGRVVMMSAIDNLVKGASGQAVQNMNIMLSLPQQMGLI